MPPPEPGDTKAPKTTNRREASAAPKTAPVREARVAATTSNVKPAVFRTPATPTLTRETYVATTAPATAASANLANLTTSSPPRRRAEGRTAPPSR